MQNSFYIFYVTEVTLSWQCKGIYLVGIQWRIH